MTEWTKADAYKKFQEFEGDFHSFDVQSNEAQTRLELIDKILFRVLDWNESDVEVEKHCREEGYSDYVFILNSASPLIIEAKKSGVSFTLKRGENSVGPVPFSLLAKESKAALSALQQALGYASTLGARYIAITNGKQWLITLTFVEGQKLNDRLIYVFDSIDSIRENFTEFWDCFSKTSTSANIIAENLLESRTKPAPKKLSADIPNYPVPSKRNVYVNELSIVLNKLWDVLSNSERTKEFLNYCYVESQYNEEISNYAKEILRLRHDSDNAYFNHKVEGVEDVRAEIKGSINEKPFVILGEVGRGKTSFLDYLKLFTGEDELKEYIQLQINFIDRPDHSNEVTDYIYEQIDQMLVNEFGIDSTADEIVKGVLDLELKRYRRSARFTSLNGDSLLEKADESKFIQENISNKHQYFKRLFQHIKRGQKKSISVFFDNLDRRGSDIQEAAYLKASSIARDWECVVFICLRPDTYYESLKHGLLDSLAPKTFTIGPPDLKLVLKRRFDYARKISLGEISNPILEQVKADINASLKLPSVAEIFSCCELSTRKNSSAIDMLTALSNSNIRELLDLTKSILTSQYLDTRKIIARIKEKGKYFVPDFEAIKTLIFSDYNHFDPKTSVFINLFDIYSSDKTEHLLEMLILEYLGRYDVNSESGGYVEQKSFLSYLQSHYFTSKIINRHLDKLIQGKCVAVEILESRETKYRVLSKGKFHVSSLTQSFQYYDAMIIDTPIIDKKIMVQMNDSTGLDQRLGRTKAFIGYLLECCDELKDQATQQLIKTYLSKGKLDVDKICDMQSK